MLRHDTKAAAPGLQGAALIREVEMEVIFGTPSKNCAGAGVCLIANRFPQGYMIPCPHAPALIHLIPGQELVFRFRKRYLNDPSVRAYFTQVYFQVDEPFGLPKRLVRLWNLSNEWVPSGRYLLEEYAQEWRLYFPL